MIKYIILFQVKKHFLVDMVTQIHPKFKYLKVRAF